MYDCHTHTHNSPDAEGSVDELCQRAVELGLSVLAVTDHCEANRLYSMEYYNAVPNGYDTFNFLDDFERSVDEIIQTRDKYADKLILLCGTELGQATHDFEAAEKIVSDKRLDFVIGSMHQIPEHDDFAFLKYENYDVKELLKKYFLEILKLCEWGKFDTLGHLTYTLRYIEGNAGIMVDMKPYRDIIAEAFKNVIEKGKAIEINTSGLRQKYGKTFPALEYIKLYKELGGELITIGSDSHCAADLAKGVADGIELAKAAGFDKICYFKCRKPVFISI